LRELSSGGLRFDYYRLAGILLVLLLSSLHLKVKFELVRGCVGFILNKILSGRLGIIDRDFFIGITHRTTVMQLI
jgi:hypothetical protein